MLKKTIISKSVSYLCSRLLQAMLFSSVFLLLSFFGCKNKDEIPLPTNDNIDVVMDDDQTDEKDDRVEGVDYFLPDVDLSNWKVTLPVPREDGKPMEVEPPAILDYATNQTLLPFMYNDSTDGSLVFYTYPGSTTTNSSYSRTELREQLVPGSNNTNWTFGEGGTMKGTLSVPDISVDSNGDLHRTMIMQIHGRLTNEQRDLIGEDDNNAPPVLKIYWQKNKVRVVTKKLKDENSSYEDLLSTSAWTDDDDHYFSREVANEKFTLEVIVSQGKIEVIMDEEETLVIENASLQKWGVFENYFKAGNYLQSTSKDAYAYVKYYNLTVSH